MQQGQYRLAFQLLQPQFAEGFAPIARLGPDHGGGSVGPVVGIDGTIHAGQTAPLVGVGVAGAQIVLDVPHLPSETPNARGGLVELSGDLTDGYHRGVEIGTVIDRHVLDGLLYDGLLLLQGNVGGVIPMNGIGRTKPILLLQRRHGDLSSLPIGTIEKLHAKDVNDAAKRAKLTRILEEFLIDFRLQFPLQFDEVGMFHRPARTGSVGRTAILVTASAAASIIAPSGRTHASHSGKSRIIKIQERPTVRYREPM